MSTILSQEQKTEYLYKKYLGYPNAYPGGEPSVEAPGSARLKIFSSLQLFSQSIPTIAPTSTNLTQDNSFDNTFGYKYISNDYPHLVKYVNLKLATVLNNKSYKFDGGPNSQYPNLLSNTIPSNYDSVSNSYEITVFRNNLPVPRDDWILDIDAGYITFYKGFSTDPALLPRITFWRYEGEIGLDNITNNGNNLVATNWTTADNGDSIKKTNWSNISSFTINGSSSENSIITSVDPYNRPTLVWKCENKDDITTAGDGGWNVNFKISEGKNYMSIIYVKRISNTHSGSFLHGCSTSTTNNLNNTQNINPYFLSIDNSALPHDIWCVSVGFIYSSNNASTTNSTFGGLYRLDTGQKIASTTSYKIKPSSTSQTHRVYLNSVVTTISMSLYLWNPEFYEVDGSELYSIQNIIPNYVKYFLDSIDGTTIGSKISGSTTGTSFIKGNVGIGTDTPSAKLEIVQEAGSTFNYSLKANGVAYLKELYVDGDITVTGTQYISSSQNISDPTILLNVNGTGADTEKSGIEIYRGVDITKPKQRLIFDESDDKWKVGLIDNEIPITLNSSSLTPSSIPYADSNGNLTPSPMYYNSEVDGIGIGTNEPSAKLHVLIQDSDTIDAFRIDDENTDETPFIVNSAGNVGISQPSPKSSLHIAETQLFNIIPPSPTSGYYWYEITRISNTNSDTNNEFRINGILSSFSEETGKAFVDISFSIKGGRRVTGTINGKIGDLADIEIYNNTNINAYIVYIKVGQNALVNINLQRIGVDAVFTYDSAGYSPTTPLGTLIYNLKDGAKDSVNNPFIGGILRNSDGNVGIGTSTPNATLHLKTTSGTAEIVDGLGVAPIISFRRKNGTDAVPTALSSTQVLGALYTSGYNTSTGTYIDGSQIRSVVDGAVSTNDMPSALVFYTTPSGSASLFERMKINKDGNIGIGTGTTINAKLHISQNGTGASFRVDDIANDETPFIVDTDGNIGIGTATPSGKLNVVQTSDSTLLQLNGLPSVSETYNLPPAIMTSNTLTDTSVLLGGTYTTSASTFTTNLPPYLAFDGDTTTYWLSLNQYDGSSGNSTGVYTGATSGIKSINGINGEYIILQCPVAFKLTGYRWRTRDYINAGDPRIIYLFGSNNGTIWTQIAYKDTQPSGQSLNVPSTGYYTPDNTSTAYKYFAFLVNAITIRGSSAAVFLATLEYTGTLETLPKMLIRGTNSNTMNIYPYENAGVVGIGTATPNTSALLDLTSTTKGLLLPRMATSDRNDISTPAEGLVIYDTTDKTISYRDNIAWRDAITKDCRNLAANKWTVGATQTLANWYYATAYNIVGSTDENVIENDLDPYGRPAILWSCKNKNEVDFSGDGGFELTIPVSEYKNYISAIYVKRVGTPNNGVFYHGCGYDPMSTTMTGADPGNAYFFEFGISSLPQDVWCVSIGLIYASNHTSTTNSTFGGIYRLDTGERLSTGKSFKMKTGTTVQQYRAFLYYSNPDNNGVVLQFWNPQFYEINGNEASLTTSFNTIKTNASGNVGIGNISPNAKLHIVQPTASTGTIFRIDDETNDTTPFIVDEAGNVGIGTSTPERKLHIQGNNTVMRLDRDTNTCAVQLHVFPTNNYTTPIKGFIFGVDAVSGSINDGSFYFGDYGTNVSGTPTKRFVIDNTGNIGFGTITPSSKIHIYNTSYQFPPLKMTNDTLTISGNSIDFYNGSYTVSTATVDTGYTRYSLFNRQDTSEWRSNTGLFNTTSPFLYTGGSTLGGVPGEWIKLTMTNPIMITSYRFKTTSLVGNHPRIWSLLASNDDNTWVTLQNNITVVPPTTINTYYSMQSSFTNNGNYSIFAFVIKNTDGINGFVRLNEIEILGLPSNGSGLLVEELGNANMTIRSGSNSSTSSIYLATPTSATAKPKAAIIAQGTSSNSRSKLYFCLENSSEEKIVTTTDSKMMIDTNGNVGIGTTTPLARLHIVQPTESTGDILRVDDETGDLTYFRIDDGGSSYFNGGWINLQNAQFATNGDDLYLRAKNSFINIQPNTNFTFSSAFAPTHVELADNALYINSSKNVGIGTTTPSATLHLKTTSSTAEIVDGLGVAPIISFRRKNGTDAVPTALSNTQVLGALYTSGYNTTTGSYLDGSQIRSVVDGAVSTNDMPSALVFYTTPSGSSGVVERMIINKEGNVGIGTTTPKCPLHIGTTQMINILIPASPTASNVFYWYKLTEITYISTTNTNNEFRINGILSSHTTATGKAFVDISFSVRGDSNNDNPRVTGIINGIIGTAADIEIYRDTSNSTYTMYLKVAQFNLVNINLQRIGGFGLFLYDGTYVSTDPTTATNTLVYNLKDGIKSTTVFKGGILRNCDGDIGIDTSKPVAKLHIDNKTTSNSLLIEYSNSSTNNTNAYLFLPSAMTANTTTYAYSDSTLSNGTYIASATSFLDNNTVYSPFRAFDLADSTAWHSYSGSYSLSSDAQIRGTYLGSNSLTSTSGTFTGARTGEYITLETPKAFKLTSYRFKTRSSTNRGDPKETYLFGSNDKITWYGLDAKTTGLTTSSNTFNGPYNITTSNYYRYFALLINKTTPSNDSSPWVSINNIEYTGVSENNVALRVRKDTDSIEFFPLSTAGNVGIGTTTPNTTAILDLTSTTKGLLPPRTTTSSITSPATGLTIYDTVQQTLAFRDNSTWNYVSKGVNILQYLTNTWKESFSTTLYNASPGNIVYGVSRIPPFPYTYFSISLTPKNTFSLMKINAVVCIGTSSATAGAGVWIARKIGSASYVKISTGIDVGNREVITSPAFTQDGNFQIAVPIMIEDYPNTTELVTYQVMVCPRAGGGSWGVSVNMSYSNADNNEMYTARPVSTISVMEIEKFS